MMSFKLTVMIIFWILVVGIIAVDLVYILIQSKKEDNKENLLKEIAK